jgi:fructokinase
MKHQPVIIFGEVLFDTFPDGSKTLGGAPFNVAWHLQAFGLNPLVISRLGDDAAGREVRNAMADWGMDVSGLQTDPQLPTGQVLVEFREGEPLYQILHPAAFDAIEYPPAAHAASNHRGLLYHGSLALRAPASRQAFEQLREQLPRTTFIDVNLRSPWWQKEEVLEWVAAADWVKLNESELQNLSNGEGSAHDQGVTMLQQYGLTGVVLTLSGSGAELLTAERSVYQVRPRSNIRLVDTVGAGDAFTSVMLLGLLNEWPREVTLRRAQDFASEVCAHRGATVRDQQFYQSQLERWKCDSSAEPEASPHV